MIVVDVETTGVNPRKHSILSIGAVDYNNPVNTFYGECRAWEGAHVMPEALEVNGFTEEMVWSREAKSMEELMAEFLVWSEKVDSKILAGHNVCFDKAFLQISTDIADLNWPFGERVIDTHSLTYVHMKQKEGREPFRDGHSMIDLSRIIEYCNLPSREGHHNALEDAELTAEVISRLTDGKNLVEKFREYKVVFVSPQ
jgi:DNA polymerase III epsilon subunit-like protein